MILEIFMIFVALATTILVTLFAIPTGMGLHYFLPIIILVISYALSFGLVWLFLSLFSLPYNKNKKYNKVDKWSQFWFGQALQFIKIHCNINLVVNEKAALPNERFLLVCNHRSNFDPILIADKYGKRDLAFISKPSNFKIPIVGRYMKKLCHLSIDSLDKTQSFQVMKDAIELITNNVSNVAVFPEGRRVYSPEMEPFHEGVFMIATRSNAPIVVATIDGTELVHKRAPFKKTTVTLNIIAVLHPEEYKGMVVKDISDHCYEIMAKDLKKD